MAEPSSFHKFSNSRSISKSRAGIVENPKHSNQSSILVLPFSSHIYIVSCVLLFHSKVRKETQTYNLSLDPQPSHHFLYPQTTGESAFEYAAKPMEDYSQPTHRRTATPSSSRLGLGIRPTSNSPMPGEIVEAPRGCHIIKATGRKDRHSKVCTAKGPRDRRVRLAAHTAIQFYDVQDRLGYDRPSKAVDWLIKKAKAAIDELPPPNSTASTSPSIPPVNSPHEAAENSGCVRFSLTEDFSGDRRMVGGGVAELVNNQNISNFLPPSMHSDSIADTMKSFFPMGAAAAETPSRTSSQSQDLRLSLQSFQDPILQLHHHHHHHQAHQQQQNEQAFLGFDSSAATWQEHHHNQQQQQAELNRFQRMLTWSNVGETNHLNSSTNGVNGGGFTFSSLPLSQSPQTFLFGGQSQLFTSQRGPLQSSNSPPIHAWIDQNDHITDHQMAPSTMHHHQQSSISGMGYASGVFPGFHNPARIQGEEEQHDGISDKPSSASSNSRH